MPRMVYCVKLKRELPGLEKPPFPGELGQRIYENVSKQAWEMWPAESTRIISQQGLNMADPAARQLLRKEMEKFFFGDEAKAPAVAGAGAASAQGNSGGPRMVFCVKLQRELPGLDRPPFPGELGKRIYEHVSKQAWEMWPAQSTLIINHYGLNMADPEARKILREQMEEFFFGEDAKMPEGWIPEEAGVGAGPARKGGGGAPRKK
ncbi:MAG TPA: oxidative damage protection protein [Ktedonobacteraceae bacterium]|nr:oxidative damage protection protein [Ktedonobacteraceae bacterium]